MRKQLLLTIFAAFFLAVPGIFAQQQELYTFCTGSSYSYLIDTAGSTSSYYARWTTGSTSYSSHFSKDTIFQTSGTGSGGGSWGSVKKWACTSTTAATCVWTYTVSGGHHDICPLPNGNVLIIVSDSKTATQVTAAGGSYSGTVKSEKIQEIHPTGATTGTVVWEWKLWDHLCQSASSTKPNYYSNVALAPQLMNVNYNMSSDWIHMNGIDYNPTLDQIVCSSHFMNEIYIIDHSTTTAEAATHAGGNAGQGGDFLYRWGNPAAYNCTAGGNGVTLNTIHDARWVSANNSTYPNYISMYHNNGGGTVQAVLFLPPHSTSDPYNYTYTPGSVIPPTSCTKPTIPTITGVADQGGIQALDNGNILITKPNNTFYECSGTGTTYQNVSVGSNQADRLKKCEVLGPFPTASTSTTSVCVGTAFTLSSAATAPLQTSPSYSYSWSSTPVGFTATSQNPTATPTTAGTNIYTVTITSGGCSNTASVAVTVNTCVGIEETAANLSDVNVFPNPTNGIINLDDEFISNNNFEIFVSNFYGEIVTTGKNSKTLDLSEFSNGIYFLTIKTDAMNIINKKIILMK
jgi:hypothetical protein